MDRGLTADPQPLIPMTAQSAHQKLAQRLTRLRALIAAHRVLTGMGIALAFVLGAGLVLIALESIFYLRPILKLILEGACALCVAFLIGYFCVMPIVKPPRLDEIALRVERHFGGLQQHLINALQLWRHRDRDGHATALVDAAIIQAEEATQHLAFETLIDRKPPIRAAMAAIALAVVALLLHALWPTALAGAAQRLATPQTHYTRPPDTHIALRPGHVEVVGGEPLAITAHLSGVVPRNARLYIREAGAQSWASFVLPVKQTTASHRFPAVTRSFNYRLSAHDAQTPIYTASVHPRPIVTRISHDDRFPPHTHFPDRIDQQGGDIVVPTGTEVALTIEANKSIETATLVFDDSSRLPAAVDSSRAQVVFTVAKDGRYRVVMRDAHMVGNEDPVSYRVVALPDHPPEVRLLHPGRDVDLTESLRVSLLAEAFDDYGVSRLELRYDAVDHTGQPQVIPIAMSPGREVEAAYHWDMAVLNLLPGDRVSYHIRAYDNNPTPSYAETATFTIRLPSLFEIHEAAEKTQRESIDHIESVQERGRDLDRRLQDLARQLMSKDALDWQEKREFEKALQTQAELADEIQATAEQLDRALDQLEDSGLLEDDTLQKLDELHDLLSQIRTPELMEVMKKLDEAVQNADADMVREALAEFQNEREKFHEGIDRALALLQRVRQQQTLDALGRKLEELARAQGQLTQHMERDPADDLARRQVQIARDTEQLREELHRAAQEMDNPTASDLDHIAAAMRREKFSDRMDRVREDLAFGQRQSARQKSDAIAGDLQALSQRFADARQRFIQRQKDEVARDLNRVLHDLLALSRAQERTAQRADEARDRSETAPLARDQARTIAGASRMAGRMLDASRKSFFLPPRAQAALGNALNKMEEAAEHLNAGHADRAPQLAREAMGALNTAAMMVQAALGQLASSQSGTGFEEMMAQMAALAQRQGDVNDQTENLFGRPGQQPSWQRLAAQQRAIQDALDALRDELAQQRREMLGDLGKIAGDMRETARELAQRQISPQTLTRQRQILSRLLDAQRAMRERGKSKKRQARTGENITYRGPGSLPANLGEADNPLRRLMRDALKQGYSAEYQALIRRYFENLIAEEKRIAD